MIHISSYVSVLYFGSFNRQKSLKLTFCLRSESSVLVKVCIKNVKALNYLVFPTHPSWCPLVFTQYKNSVFCLNLNLFRSLLVRYCPLLPPILTLPLQSLAVFYPSSFFLAVSLFMFLFFSSISYPC